MENELENKFVTISDAAMINLGTKSGLPKYFALVAIVYSSILFVPEAVWELMGITSLRSAISVPQFIEYNIANTSYKNSYLVFSVLAPFALLSNTWLFIAHVNNRVGYSGYLQRREARCGARNSRPCLSLLLSAMIFVTVYVWSTAFYLEEPLIFGDFVPSKNRLAMVMVHGGALSLVLPLSIALIVTEIRIYVSRISFL